MTDVHAREVGAEWLRLGDLVPGEADVLHRAPVSLALVTARDGTRVLVGTGLPAAVFETPERFASLYERPCEGEPGAAARMLDELGVAPDLIVLTHLHLDHTGGLPDVPRVPVVVQRRELEWARGVGIEHAVLASDLAAADGRWRVVDGETDVAPGVTLLPTPGHTPGHQSVRAGGVVLVGDALERRADLHRELPVTPGAYAGAEADVRGTAEALRRLAAAGDELIPCHCPEVWEGPGALSRRDG